MNEDLQQRIQAALANPQNMGEMTGADSIGTVGNADCGEMLRLWVKFKEQNGRKVIDRATFQSFGCETAIAVASLATELIRGKTAEEALALHQGQRHELGQIPGVLGHENLVVPEGAEDEGHARGWDRVAEGVHISTQILWGVGPLDLVAESDHPAQHAAALRDGVAVLADPPVNEAGHPRIAVRVAGGAHVGPHAAGGTVAGEQVPELALGELAELIEAVLIH